MGIVGNSVPVISPCTEATRTDFVLRQIRCQERDIRADKIQDSDISLNVAVGNHSMSVGRRVSSKRVIQDESFSPILGTLKRSTTKLQMKEIGENFPPKSVS